MRHNSKTQHRDQKQAHEKRKERMSSVDVLARSAPQWKPVGAWPRKEYVSASWSPGVFKTDGLMHDGGPGLSEMAFEMEMELDDASVETTTRFGPADWQLLQPRAASPSSKHLGEKWGRMISPNDVTVLPQTVKMAAHPSAHDTIPWSPSGMHGPSARPSGLESQRRGVPDSSEALPCPAPGGARSFKEEMEEMEG